LLIYVIEILARQQWFIFGVIKLMKRNTRIILLLCCLSVPGVILLQAGWLTDYYKVNKDRFDKDVNLAFEDAVKKEFMLRCDTLENLLYHFLMDTAQVSITSEWNEKNRVYQYNVKNKKDTTDKTSFSIKKINAPIANTNIHDSVKQLVARRFAGQYRDEDLERHIIYYKTQNIGKYIGDKAAGQFAFDTGRLRPLLKQYLAGRDIYEPFYFYTSDTDSLLNKNHFSAALTAAYPVITKAFPTYRYDTNINYVRAMFGTPRTYLFGKMIWMLAGSLLLLGMVVFSLYYLLYMLGKEKKLSAIKNDFINNITHELKTPVTTASAAMEALQDFDVLQNPEKAHKYISLSRREMERLSGMIEKILNLAIYENQDFELKLTPVNVDALIKQLINSYTSTTQKQISIHYACHLTTPVALLDELHFYSALNNLLDNAVKYSGPVVVIDIVCSQQNGYIVVQVKDNGLGIAKEDIAFVFDKFYRSAKNNHSVKGHGLGLAYVSNIIQKHKGWYTVDSRENFGSTFKLAIPV
jgi:two-component system phosphate regulon sensor histidine kinase PhoR